MDNLLDPSHVSWVHQTSFASSGTQDTPLVREERADGLVVTRWITDAEVPPYYARLVKFKGAVTGCSTMKRDTLRLRSIPPYSFLPDRAENSGATRRIHT